MEGCLNHGLVGLHGTARIFRTEKQSCERSELERDREREREFFYFLYYRGLGGVGEDRVDGVENEVAIEGDALDAAIEVRAGTCYGARLAEGDIGNDDTGDCLKGGDEVVVGEDAIERDAVEVAGDSDRDRGSSC